MGRLYHRQPAIPMKPTMTSPFPNRVLLMCLLAACALGAEAGPAEVAHAAVGHASAVIGTVDKAVKIGTQKTVSAVAKGGAVAGEAVSRTVQKIGLPAPAASAAHAR
jgi:hypothetical protein